MTLLRNKMKDKLTLVKKDGQTFGVIDALVSSNVIFTENVSLRYEVEDVFERALPSGLIERLIIVDPVYCKSPFPQSPIRPHFQIKFKREGVISRNSIPQTVNYNLQGANSRVNIGSVDQSINVTALQYKELLGEIRQVIQDKIDSDAERSKLLDKTVEFENARSTSTLMKKYSELMELAANHVAVLPYVVKLGKMIAGVFK